MSTSSDIQYYRQLPKVELHRHLEGSLRLRTLREVGREIDLGVLNTHELRQKVQVATGQRLTITNFFSKFQILRQFYRSEEIIERITREAIQDAALDKIRYLELRFTPVALSRAEGFPLAEVFDWVIESARQGQELFGVTTALIASFNRHEQVEPAFEVAQLAADRLGRGIVGLDMAGDEANYSGKNFMKVLLFAREAGLRLTVHAGEWGPAANVTDAILHLGADRIGHGVRVLEDPEAVALARDRRIPFEVCLTSNYRTGVVPSLTSHPLSRMLEAGLNVTLNTDDPGVLGIQLSNEFQQAGESLGVAVNQLRGMVLAAAQAAFVSEIEKSRLLTSLSNELKAFEI